MILFETAGRIFDLFMKENYFSIFESMLLRLYFQNKNILYYMFLKPQTWAHNNINYECPK